MQLHGPQARAAVARGFALMELSIHSCGPDLIVFTAAHQLPPREAMRLPFAPELRGMVHVSERDAAGAWREIVAQVERHHFATVGTRQAALLMGADHACFSAPAPADTR